MTAKHTAAIVGLNWIGAEAVDAASHVSLGTTIPRSHAASYAAIPSVDVTAVCDRLAERREGFISTWRDRFPNVRAFADLDDLLETAAPEIISIATSDNQHTSLVLAAIRAGVPAVVCEKPLATTLTEVDAILDASLAAGTVISVNFTRRWNPWYVLARRMLQEGVCGELSRIHITGGGERAMLYRNGSHVFDLACYYANSEPVWVWAELEEGWSRDGDGYIGGGGLNAESEPGYDCVVAFANGVRALISDQKSMSRELRVELVGDQGRITVSDEEELVVHLRGKDGRVSTSKPMPTWTVRGLQAGILEVVEALETGNVGLSSTAASARGSASIIDAILRSHRASNTPVAAR